MRLFKRVRLFAFIGAILSLFALASCGSDKNTDVIATNYVGYDFAKNLCKDTSTSVSMLLEPGAEIHGYQPSTTDMKAILNCKVFIYVGGESDVEWVESDILPKIDTTKTKVVSMFSALENGNGTLLGEEDPNGEEEHDHEHEHEHEEEEEYDEHVWNNLDNASIILKAISSTLKEINSEKSSVISNNETSYLNKINEVKTKFSTLLASKSKIMVFADRFPLLYFVNEFNITYDAALNGCSQATEASANATIRLVNAIKENNLKYIFTIELSEQKIAKSIQKEIKSAINSGSYTGSEVEILTFYTMHNISKEDFDKGLTFVDYLNKNYDTMELYLA